ncbi:hypothetical protein [Formosa sp. PL04]|uniref:hypothetical protein n=1 Tax=Formosa sp. PL04 TaxID=3081755 RepID=UPI00298120A5|nr:hypothetical protein [Formosa sp. PL04]MDW5290943.1 hypothetical protein [Formosa sp. PL04]
MTYNRPYKFISIFILFLICNISSWAQGIPEILQNKKMNDKNYLPDFSFAGYYNGEKSIPRLKEKIVLATDYGVIANDGLDDSKALQKALEAVSSIQGNVVLQLPKGRIILSDILYLERSHFVLRGAGTGEGGTEMYYPRPLMYVKDPEALEELREYLVEFDKRQKEKENNIDLPFTQYAWAGGFIWTRVPGVRVKSYLKKYEQEQDVLGKIESAKRGTFSFEVSEMKALKVGDVVELQVFNKDGEKGELITDLYKNEDVKVGSHHWNFPELPLVKQQVTIWAISGHTVTINSPLTIDIKPNYKAQLVAWKHLEEVGIEDLKITFPKSPRVAHHVEPGFNALYLTRIFNSWVRNVIIENADSGIITEEIANVTLKNITTTGENIAHYTVMMQATYNVLAQGIKVYNKAVHPLSFNTFSTKSVYSDCEIFVDPILDQHSGANHQNLFDNIKVHVNPKIEGSYPLFEGGGAGYWKPSHGAYNTFWNINVSIEGGLDNENVVLLNGMDNGPFARIIGVQGNHEFKIDYGPNAYIEFINKSLKEVPSLYSYQLKKRLKNN